MAPDQRRAIAKTRSGTVKNQTPVLKDAELDVVTGGKDASLQAALQKYSSMMSLLTSLLQMQHETAKGIIQNIRA